MKLVEHEGEYKVQYERFHSFPSVVSGFGDSGRMMLNHFGSYLAKAYLPGSGCQLFNEDTITLDPEDVRTITTRKGFILIKFNFSMFVTFVKRAPIGQK